MNRGFINVLNPNSIIHMGGKRFRLINRKARVGEKVIVVNAFLNGKSYENGDIFDVYKVRLSGIIAKVDYKEKEGIALIHSEYYVLEPLDSEQELITATEGDNKSIIDLLTNITQRLTLLERKLEQLESKVVSREGESNGQNINY